MTIGILCFVLFLAVRRQSFMSTTQKGVSPFMNQAVPRTNVSVQGVTRGTREKL